MDSDTIAGIIFVIACGCVLPIVLDLLNTRRKMNENEVRKQIVLAAIENNRKHTSTGNYKYYTCNSIRIHNLFVLIV